MDEFVAYVLYSDRYDRFYKGYTTSLIERIKSHNLLATKGYTIKYRPWKVVHVAFFRTKKEAIKRERFLKSGAGRAWIKKHFDPGKGFISA